MSQGWHLLEDSWSQRFSQQRRFQPARWLAVEKVFQPGKVATCQRNRRRKGFPTSQGFNQLEGSWLKMFFNKLKLQPARGLVKKVFQPAKAATRSKNRLRKGFPFSRSCKELEDSSSKRFSNQPRLQTARRLVIENLFPLEDSSSKSFSNTLTLQQARGLVVEKVFQQANIGASSRTRRRKGFPTSSRTCRKGFQISKHWNKPEYSSSKRFPTC